MDHPQHLTAAHTAKRLGVTVRALRVYEREGLIRPLRLVNGYRAYGPEELARLHQVLALKRLGLPLRRIGELLKGGRVDLDRLLAFQEAALAEQQGRVKSALRLIRAARARLARGETLPTDDLVQLVRETAMSDYQWGPEHEALADKHFTSEQREALKARYFSGEDQAASCAAWEGLIAEAERLRAIGDPASPEARNLAQRWNAEVDKFTGGDPAISRAAAGMYQEAFADPSKARLSPISQELWLFVAEASRRLPERQEAG